MVRFARPPNADYSAAEIVRSSCSSAACSVFASSVAMVIGPTPPGTGVIHPALAYGVAKWT
jgi:hypothetical protein